MKLENLSLKEISIEDYIKEREIIRDGMESPDWLGGFDKEELSEIIDNEGILWAWYHDKDFVCSALTFPTTAHAIKKFCLDGYKEGEVITYATSFVKKIYRGNNLLVQMLNYLNNYYKEQYKLAVGTVHPDNIWSSQNLDELKFTNKGELNLTRGKRILYIKEL